MSVLERDMVGRRLHQTYAKVLRAWAVEEVRPAIARLVEAGFDAPDVVADVVTVLHEEADRFGFAALQALS